MTRRSLLVVTAALLIVGFMMSTQAEGIVLSGYFTDDDGSTFEADIDAIADQGITKGCNPPANTRFCPNDDLTRGQMAAFLRRALGLPAANEDFFADDDGSTFEADINSIAAAGITKGCNPPANTRFCPNDDLTRGQMAAFLRRALGLPSSTQNWFDDDDNSVFETDINAIAEEGITRGCNPPVNNRFCPNDNVTRGAMAAFIRRALELPAFIQTIPVGDHSAMTCSKDGERCTLVVDLSANRTYRIEEAIFQVTPASAAELAAFDSVDTSFTLSIDGAATSIGEIQQASSGGQLERRWRRNIQFAAGTHTLVGRWEWEGTRLQTTTVTIRARD